MKIAVSVKPGAREEKIEKHGGEFIVSTMARAEEGKANEAVIKIIARYFGVASSRVEIISGYASRKKRIEIV